MPAKKPPGQESLNLWERLIVPFGYQPRKIVPASFAAEAAPTMLNNHPVIAGKNIAGMARSYSFSPKITVTNRS